MNILGINAFHADSSAALLQNGILTAAVEEERFVRKKHWAGFPENAIVFCLKKGKLAPEEIDHVAISFNPQANFFRKFLYAITHRPSVSWIRNRLMRQAEGFNIKKRLSILLSFSQRNFKPPIHYIEHHNAHIAGGFFLSPFKNSAILSVDGMGDFVSTVSAYGDIKDFKRLSTIFFPHSLGYLYNAITLYLGFPNYGDEYKVMALASMGKPVYMNEFRDIIICREGAFRLNLKFFSHHLKGIRMKWDHSIPEVKPYHSEELERLLGPVRKPDDPLNQQHYNIAASLQKATEETVFYLLEALYKKCSCNSLVVTGGVALNSVLNGKITNQTPFKELFISPGPGDNGLAYGAAYYVWHKILKKTERYPINHAYWGNEYSEDDFLEEIGKFKITKYKYYNDHDLPLTVATDISNGAIIGWFQGREEFGPRALGNRSLLADPRRADIRGLINTKIKGRESFRPFAPAILEEYTDEYFDFPVHSPFMEKVLPVTESAINKIPGVIHSDHTARPQTVSKSVNLPFWKLIDTFRVITGVPLLLNTSLNENEPIVHSPFDAIQFFLRTEMDGLVLGNYYLKK